MDDREVPDAMHPQLGVCLRAARQARGLTFKQVAERTGMALSTLSKVGNNQMSLTYDKLLQLTFGLKMQIAELFNPANSAPSPRRSSQPGAASAAAARDKWSTQNSTPTNISAPI
jgi:transcriptional regulator with XRE-family HTH domain